jgi:hypothetical protein
MRVGSSANRKYGNVFYQHRSEWSLEKDEVVVSKKYIGPHQACELRANGRWDPATMTENKFEAASEAAASIKPAHDDAIGGHYERIVE